MKQLFVSDSLADPKLYPDQNHCLYVWSKSIKPTSGRIIGNMAANIGAGAVHGYETAMYGAPVTPVDADAFALDYHTIFMVARIEPSSGEILSIDQYRMPYELTDSKSRDHFIKMLYELFNINFCSVSFGQT